MHHFTAAALLLALALRASAYSGGTEVVAASGFGTGHDNAKCKLVITENPDFTVPTCNGDSEESTTLRIGHCENRGNKCESKHNVWDEATHLYCCVAKSIEEKTEVFPISGCNSVTMRYVNVTACECINAKIIYD